ncbi:hypothetical protein TL16_g02874 [Triparma laevis f. inornata]|uniref:Transglutaminase-like domain-containing protein n=1 Tax=Triparma laevis f. inornata TaxID=1714386 RepID=A0A9W7DYC7_9STRA|nr:hypothetical protein TL16_g02874 [Triparma laevis f. inornata]
MLFRSSLLLAANLLATVNAGFDWGVNGCDGGSGTFTQTLPTAGETALIGEITTGKWNLLIKLESTKDVDVQLFDKSDSSCDGGEKAIIAYNEKKGCGKGTLGNNDGSKESTTYKGMQISYSGYYGVDGKMGFEYIRLEGEVKSPLIMKAFAFEAGDAKVSYEWGYTRTPTCLGILPLTGTMSSSVTKDTSVEIGEIIVGKKDLRITLTADKDVDVTLYDKGADSLDVCPGKGKYSEDADQCKKGALGNNDDGGEESVVYNGVTYGYSGYSGVGGKLGNEWVQLTGVTNTPLLMSAFGFASGDFKVDYEYYEVPPPGEIPTQPSVHWLAAKNNKLSKTDVFTGIPSDYNIVRRGGSFEFLIFGGAGVSLSKDNVNIAIIGEVAAGTFAGDPRATTDDLEARKTANFKIATKSEIYPAEAYTVEFDADAENRFLVKVSFTSSAPIGEFKISASVAIGEGRGTKTATAEQNFIVLFDPTNSDDVVYTTKSNRDEYVDNTEGLVWQGLSDNNNGFSWSFNQWDFANLQIAYDRLVRMPVADRGDPVLVSRHITYSVGEDICYGKWGEGSYTTGRPYGGYTCSGSKPCTTPDDWRDSTSLFATHRSIGRKVQYCQCFVYAAITTSIGRSLGIPTRPVTTFQSAHDTDKNRAIEKFYTIDPANGEFVPVDGAPTGDSVWSFHVWNEMYFDRPEFDYATCKSMGQRKGCADGWQAVDATPQETSMGGSGVDPEKAHYQMGPASIKLLLKNKDPVCPFYNTTSHYGCFDNEFVLSEVNSDVHMWVKTDDASKEVRTRRRRSPTRTKPSEERSDELSGSEEGGDDVFYSEGLGYSLYGEIGWESDAWGDKYNTIGLQISTKKKGAISDECKRDTDKDCSAELDDVTKYYKKKENSGPGLPTDIKSAIKYDVPGATEYYKPDLGAEGHRRARNLRQNERRADGVSGVKMNNIGTAPGAANLPVVNQHGHFFSDVYVNVPFLNEGSETYTVKCGFNVYTTDYSETNVTKVFSDHREVSLAPNEAKSCEFVVRRSEWWKQAKNSGDKFHAGYDTPDMAINEKAYALKMEITGYVVETSEPLNVIERRKVICTPAGAVSTRSGGITCEGHRGRITVNDDFIDHNKACSTSGTVNNGKCNDDKNNAENCWDGGDCCKVSCLARHGTFIDLENSVKIDDWECDELDDSVTCLDPDIVNYPETADYDTRTSEQILGEEPTSFSGLGADDFGESICGEVVEWVNDEDTTQCDGDGEDSDECAVLLKNLLCGEEEYTVNDVSDCMAALVNNTVVTMDNKPRCAMASLTHVTNNGCTCKTTWEFDDTKRGLLEYTMGSCGIPDDESVGETDYWCIVEGTDCGTNTAATETDAAYNYDYCRATQPTQSGKFAEEFVLSTFPEINNPDRGVSTAFTEAKEMTVSEVIMPDVVVETVEVEAELTFSGVETDAIPDENTPQYEEFKEDIKKGIAMALGIDDDKVTVLVMALVSERRRLAVGNLRVGFEAVVAKKTDGGEGDDVVNKLRTENVVEDIKAASVSNDAVWVGAEVLTDSVAAEIEEEEEGGDGDGGGG